MFAAEWLRYKVFGGESRKLCPFLKMFRIGSGLWMIGRKVSSTFFRLLRWGRRLRGRMASVAIAGTLTGCIGCMLDIESISKWAVFSFFMAVYFRILSSTAFKIISMEMPIGKDIGRFGLYWALTLSVITVKGHGGIHHPTAAWLRGWAVK